MQLLEDLLNTNRSKVELGKSKYHRHVENANIKEFAKTNRTINSSIVKP